MAVLGEFLNNVESPNPCPTCYHTGGMQVFEFGVRWTCGHTRRLPPLPAGGNFHKPKKQAAK